MKVLCGLLIPLLGTALGSSIVLFFKNSIKKSIEKLLLGFAAGVMIAASIWSLLLPSIDMASEQGKITWIVPTIGFGMGIIFLTVIDNIVSRLHINKDYDEKNESKLKKKMMLMVAITLHNIPEGMAVGVVFAGAIIGNTGISLAGAVALAIGIAIQNFPEGAIISMPLMAKGVPKGKAFLYGVLSGIVEPISALITIGLTNIVVPILPYLLSFAAGTMMYVVVDELIPESQEDEKSNISTIGISIGFIIMMILDIALG